MRLQLPYIFSLNYLVLIVRIYTVQIKHDNKKIP
ncbi:hypothetical protein MHA_1204 [Mannheimia haemolytica PHL213]|nr:hypothetical protein MHA_1204 [Mannheimia haemolytica PHL213]